MQTAWPRLLLTVTVGGVFTFGTAAGAQYLAAVEARDLSLAHCCDEIQVTLEVRRATRREVVEQVLAKAGVTVEWRNEVVAEEAIEGRYSGSVDEVARRLLARTSFIITYDASGAEPRMIGVLVLGGSEAPSRASSPKSTTDADQEKAIRARASQRRHTAKWIIAKDPLRPQSDAKRLAKVRIAALERMQATQAAARERAAQLASGSQFRRFHGLPRKSTRAGP